MALSRVVPLIRRGVNHAAAPSGAWAGPGGRCLILSSPRAMAPAGRAGLTVVAHAAEPLWHQCVVKHAPMLWHLTEQPRRGTRLVATARRPADPEKPKRPHSAYLRYMVDFRAKNPGLKVTETAKQAGQEWKQLGALQRAPYEEAYAKESKVYKDKLQEYITSGKQAAWKRDPEKPKKPLTGFMRFAQEFRVKRPDLGMVQQTQEAAIEWKALPQEQRKPHEDKYLQEKQVYDQAMKEYKASGKEQAWEERVGIAKKKELALKKKEAAAKKKAVAAAKKKKLAEKKLAAAAAKKKKAAEKKAKLAERKAAAKKKAAAAKEKKMVLAMAKKKKAAEAQAKKKAAADQKENKAVG